MDSESRIEALLSLYERRRDAGDSPTPAELCAADPDLVEPLSKRVAALEAGRRLLDAGDTASMDGHPATVEIPAMPDLNAPGYEIIRVLGHGGMGVVYLARQVALDRMVALKTVHAGAATEQARSRMRREAAVIAKLTHPNIVQVFESGDANGITYFALELVSGGSLAEKLREGPFEPRAAAVLVRTLAGALEATHKLGVIHCDLKPANVLLAPDGSPKVADFGLAREFEASDRQTRTGTIRGTASYMAPEQAAGRIGDLGPPADIYALGGLLYEMLTGRPPFLAATIFETLHLVIRRDPVPPRRFNPAVPADLETICLKCLAKERGKRYGSAVELGEDLGRFLEGRSISARRAGTAERAWRWCRRNPSLASLAAVSAAFFLSAIIGTLWTNRRLDAELDRTRQAMHTAESALVSQAADRMDGELRELAALPRSIAAAIEAGETVRADWLSRVVAADERVFGVCVALETEEFALFVHKRPEGLATRRLDKEEGPPYRTRDWYTRGRHAGRGWTDLYHGTDELRTPMVSHVVPILKDGKFAGVVVLDLAVETLRSAGDTLSDLIPGIDDACQVRTEAGDVLFETPGFAERAAGKSLSAAIPSTGWRLIAVFPEEGR